MEAKNPETPGKARPQPYRLLRSWWLAVAAAWIAGCFALAAWQSPHPDVFRSAVAQPLLDWLLYPVEDNAWQRLPGISTDLSSVAFASDGRRGWAAGGGGAIFATSDGGLSWTPLASGTDNHLLDLASSADGLRVWAAGAKGMIVVTADGGASWSAQAVGDATLHDIMLMEDGQRGWAVGSGGTILSTNDGGKSWLRAESGTTSDLRAMAFSADGRRGWAVGSRGSIAATSDGGGTWTVQRAMAGDLISVATTPDGRRAWAIGSRGELLATTEKSGPWQALADGPLLRLPGPALISVLPDGRLRAVETDGTTHFSGDGGRSWQRVARGFGMSNEMSFAFAGDERTSWGVGARGKIVATTNGGHSWMPRTRSAAGDFHSIAMAHDGIHGLVAGTRGIVMRTSDGGRTWSVQSTGVTDLFLRALALTPDGLRAWAVGQRSTVLASRDGGVSWLRSSVPAENLLSVSFGKDGRTGWAVDRTGLIVATADGGLTWTIQRERTQGRTNPLAVAARPDGARAWAVGRGGAILSWSRANNVWRNEQSPVQASLIAVAVAPDGRRAWAVGARGIILHTDDGGATWAQQPSGTEEHLESVAVAPDGRRAWAVGNQGAILATGEGGAGWSVLARGVAGQPRSVAAVDDGRAWVAANDAALLSTDDGGRTWRPPVYERRPAPWFWLAFPFALAFVGLAFLPPRAPPVLGADAIGASDAAVTRYADDRLQFVPLARGISRFLRNANTEPPLTLAITGGWGIGKSSLMHLLCSDLRAHGWKPVWFNAWHHQKEEHLLAALLEVIRKCALPSSLTPSGWLFRLRLLWLRSKKHFVATFVVLAVVAALATYLIRSGAEWSALWAWVSSRDGLLPLAESLSGAQAQASSAQALAPLLAQAVTALAAIAALLRAMKAFSAEPAVLLSKLQFRLKDASAVNSFRMRFSEQFDEVTQALPYSMVIVIDDLDRCRPEAVLEVMEAVNFLTSSGKCFVVFGMATERVQAALALAFGEIARELVDLESPGASQGKEEAERLKRRTYARDYLEKLINIEIKVPLREDIAAHELLRRGAKPAGEAAQVVAAAWSRWPIYLALTAVLSGIALGSGLVLEEDAPMTKAVPDKGLAPEGSPSRGARDVPPAGVPSSPPPREVAEPGGVAVEPQAPGGLSLGYLAPGIALLIIGILVAGLYRLRMQWTEVEDSPEFEEALRIWTPVVAARRGTPRTIKRFGNRVRYFAMLQQGEVLDQPAWREALERIRARFGWRRSTGGANEKTPVLSEGRLIALSACHEAFQGDWEARVAPCNIVTEDVVFQMAEKARMAHDASFGQAWPPSKSEMTAFKRLLAGIRMPGDVETITGSPERDFSTGDEQSVETELVEAFAERRRERGATPAPDA